MYKSQRAMITRVEPNALVSLEIIDQLQQGLLRHVSVEECCFMPLSVVNIPPSPSRIVCLHKDQVTRQAANITNSGLLHPMEKNVVLIDVIRSLTRFLISFQDRESVEKLCKTEAVLEMTVVETDATPQVKFAAAPSDVYHGDKQVII